MEARAWYQLEPGTAAFYLALAGVLLGGLGFLLLLTALPKKGKQYLIIAFTFLAGLFYSLEYYLPATSPEGNLLSPYIISVGEIAMVVGAFSFLLGVINLIMLHGNSIAQKRKGWGASVVFFAGFFATVVAGLLQFYKGAQDPSAEKTIYDAIWSYLFDGMLVPLQSTTFSLLAFYIVSASYRAFRVRSRDALLMLAAAVVLMLGQVNAGQWLTHWIPEDSTWSFLRVEVIANWLLSTVNMAAQRAVLFGLMVGELAMALRIWLSLERGAFFERKL